LIAEDSPVAIAVDMQLAPPTLPVLQRAILETLAYSDVFDYPLRLTELHAYLGVRASERDVALAVEEMTGSVEEKDGFCCLRGREAIVALRRQREVNSQETFGRALFFGRLLARLPFIRMVALTGSLALKNCDAKGDFDYMLVTAVGRVWLARGFALLVNRIAHLRGDLICPNVIVSERALEWQRKDLYSARELCQMLPINGAQVYANLRIANSWTSRILPNAALRGIVEEEKLSGTGLMQAGLERALSGPLGDQIEHWEMSRKIARFRRQAGLGPETIFDADRCQGNFQHHGRRTLLAYRERMRSLGLETVA